MIFFVAKGAPDACGSGCSEWIAAEGAIDPDAAQRFQDFLAALPGRELPIFFNSTGGIAGQAAALGRIMREHRMTAGVGRSLPEGCRHAAADACRRVMQGKREHKARLVTDGARCLSSCVYALLGASTRRVARDAQLGIHAVRIVTIPGRASTGPPPKADQIHLLLKRYMVEMGVDPGLIDAARRVSADRVRYMSRDEIARFGIETRGFFETQWMSYEDGSKRIFVLKSVTQAKGADDQEYRTSNIRLGCVGAGLGILVRIPPGIAVERDRRRNGDPRCRRRPRTRARPGDQGGKRPAQRDNGPGISSARGGRAQHRDRRDLRSA